MSALLSDLLSNDPLLLALVVLFGGGVSAIMLAFLLANIYFLPGPPSRWSLRGGVVAALLGATLTGISVPIVVLGQTGLLGLDGDEPLAVIAVGAAVYLVGLGWLELRSRPDAEWA